jgi:hypothetical protein
MEVPMQNRLRPLLGTLSLAFAVRGAVAQQPKAAPAGPVTVINYLRVDSAGVDRYLAQLAAQWKPIVDGEKKSGRVVAYAVWQSTPRDKDDWSLALLTTYRDQAAADGLKAKVDSIVTHAGLVEVKPGQTKPAPVAPTLVASRQVRERALR